MTGCDGMWETAKQLNRVPSVRVYPIFLRSPIPRGAEGVLLYIWACYFSSLNSSCHWFNFIQLI